jgi:AmmeMemoRadiSam system protein A
MTNFNRSDTKDLQPCTDSSQVDASSVSPNTSLTRVSISDEHKQLLLQVARDSLDRYLSTGKLPGFATDDATLNQVRAVFVTLWRRDTGELRGCRGESMARRPLLEAVSFMAIAAAADDPRFLPVAHEELPLLRIEINALTPLAPIHPDDVEVGRHGLLVVRGQHAGLLLPDVPVRFGWDRVQFLEGTCQKAGLPTDAWQDANVQLFGFESEEWGEPE